MVAPCRPAAGTPRATSPANPRAGGEAAQYATWPRGPAAVTCLRRRAGHADRTPRATASPLAAGPAARRPPVAAGTGWSRRLAGGTRAESAGAPGSRRQRWPSALVAAPRPWPGLGGRLPSPVPRPDAIRCPQSPAMMRLSLPLRRAWTPRATAAGAGGQLPLAARRGPAKPRAHASLPRDSPCARHGPCESYRRDPAEGLGRRGPKVALGTASARIWQILPRRQRPHSRTAPGPFHHPDHYQVGASVP